MSLPRGTVLAALCIGMATAILPMVSTSEQAAVPLRTIDIDRLTCAEFLSLSSERQDRVLIYFDGFLAGMRRQTTWDERLEGELIDRAVGYCKADPSQTVLSVFIRAAPQK